jgi:hypothetical protein
MSYNGWTNKETWLVNLWLGDGFAMMNAEGESVSADFVREVLDDYLAGNVIGGLTEDLIQCALGEINFHEIASHYQTEES